jgi:hypothetical protein
MASDEEKRALIIAYATKEIENGSHYLKGTSGAIPNQIGSGLFRNVEIVENLDIKSTTFGIHAAISKFGMCAGRWEKFAPVGKQFSIEQPDRKYQLPEYLDKLKASYKPPRDWESFNSTNLYPRRANDYMYLGEDCRNKRHFDCEGFIAWVLVNALGKDKGTWQKGVDWYQSGGGGRLKVYQAVGSNYVSADHGTITQVDILDGDILIRKPSSSGGEHIAFACAKGTGVLEASGKSVGVVRSGYKSNWTQLARIKKL